MAGESSWGEGGEREDRQDGGDPRGRREPGNVSGDVVGAAVPDGGDRGGVWGDAGGGASGGGATRVPGTSAQRVVDGKIVKTGEIPGDAESQSTFRAMWWEPRCRTAEIAEVFWGTRGGGGGEGGG